MPSENPTDICQRGEKSRLRKPLSIATMLLTTSANPAPTPTPIAVPDTQSSHNRLCMAIA